MTNLYETSSGGGLLIYAFSHQIILRQKIGDSFSRGTVLAADYKTGLSHTVYNNSLHYSYVNTNNYLVLKHTTESNALYMLENFPGLSEFSPQLVSLDGKLLILYQSPLEKEKSCIKSLFPFRPDLSLDIPLVLNSGCTINILKGAHCIFVEAYDQGLYQLIKINEDLSIDSLEPSNIKAQEIDSLNSTIDSVIRQYNDLMDVAKQYRQEAIKWRNKFTDS